MKTKHVRSIGLLEGMRQALKGFSYGSVFGARSAAVVAASTLEAILQTLLIDYFARSDSLVDAAMDVTFRNLMDRVNAAYCVGLVDRDLAISLKKVAELRNVFAHDVTVLLFTDKRVSGQLAAMGVDVSSDDENSLHNGFVAHVEDLLFKLYRAALTVWSLGKPLSPLSVAPDEEWESILDTRLRDTNAFSPADCDTLEVYGIPCVRDILSGRHSFFLENSSSDAGEILKMVSEWIADRLDHCPHHDV